jgi:anti-sigma factor RsiW
MKHVTHQIQAYLDEELARPEAQAFEAHVAGCEDCRRELDAARELWALVDQAAPQPVRATVWPGLAEKMSRRERRGPWTWSQRGLAAAALVAGLILGLQVGGSVDRLEADMVTVADGSEDYLEESLPSLDQLWLQVGDQDEESGS